MIWLESPNSKYPAWLCVIKQNTEPDCITLLVGNKLDLAEKYNKKGKSLLKKRSISKKKTSYSLYKRQLLRITQ